MPNHAEKLLRELVRQAERSVDHQLHRIEKEQGKTATAARTAVTLLTVMLSGTWLLLHLGLLKGVVLGVTGISLLAAFWVSIRSIMLEAGLQRPQEFSRGIAPRTLAHVARQDSASFPAFLEAALEQLVSTWRTNEAHLRQATRSRQRQALWLFTTFVLFLSSIAYTIATNMIR